MKHRATLPALLLLSQLLVTPLAYALEVAPDFSLAGTETQVNLADMKGQVVYLDFWASWCAPCRKSFPWMDQLKARYADQGLVIIAINLDKKRDASKEFLAATPIHHRL